MSKVEDYNIISRFIVYVREVDKQLINKRASHICAENFLHTLANRYAEDWNESQAADYLIDVNRR